ncbi:MAG: SDR family oxidoreductase [Alphaproteobacteria bacterium]|nr:MAG: SDR family oxidoreductase [Alphaproteobacteria bacterium]
MLEGRTAIVTGAATGVGLAVTRLFAQRGMRLVLTDTDAERLEQEARYLRDEGAELVTLHCDLRQRLSVNNLVALAVDSFETIDVLVNASRHMVAGDPLQTTEEDVDALFLHNVKAPLGLAQAVARRMIAQAEARGAPQPGGNGCIVNVTSIAARRTLPELLAFSVSCAALEQATRSLAVALAPHAVRVNAVALGSVMTASLRAAFKDQEETRRRLISVTPLGRIGEAAEAAEAVAFLASPQSSFITGQVLAVDGGRTLLDPLGIPAL